MDYVLLSHCCPGAEEIGLKAPEVLFALMLANGVMLQLKVRSHSYLRLATCDMIH